MVSKPISPESIAAEDPPFSLGRTLFWPARYAADAPVLYHLPFLFWLTERARPRTVLGLGLRSAVGYFALCQSIDRLGLPARAWGYGSWSAIDGNGPSVPDELRSHNAKFYRHISHLTKVNSPAAALDRFEVGTFDLILVDGSAELGDPNALADRLVAHASDRGIVLLYGIDHPGGDGAAPARKLYSILAADYPAVAFEEEEGCAAVLIGKVQDPELVRLATGPATSSAFLDFHLVLGRLGEGNMQGWRAHSAASAIAKAEAALSATRTATEAAELRAARAEEESLSLTAACEAATKARDLALSDLRDAIGQAKQTESTTLPPLPVVDPNLRAELDAAHLRLVQAQAARLHETRVLTAELERVTEDLLQLRQENAQAAQAKDTEAMLAADEAAEAARAELAALRIRHFDEVEDLRGEVAWLTQELARVQAVAESATAQALATQEALAALHAEKSADAQALERAVQDLQKLRQDSAALNNRRAAQLKLREWQMAWLTTAPRYGKSPGPSGGKLAEEVAAVARHRLFDEQWYFTTYPDLKGGKMPAAEHFVRHGLFEGRDPGPRFRTLAWFVNNPAALAARKNPLLDADLPDSV